MNSVERRWVLRLFVPKTGETNSGPQIFETLPKKPKLPPLFALNYLFIKLWPFLGTIELDHLAMGAPIRASGRV